MLIVRRDEEFYLERRAPSGIWGGLWSFPELESADELSDWCDERLAAKPLSVDEWETMRHSFSHFDLDISPLVVRVANGSRKVADGDDGKWYPIESLPQVGLAAPVEKLMKTLQALD